MISMKKVALWFGLFLLAFWLAFVPGFVTVSRAIGPTVAAKGDSPVAVKATPQLSEAWSQYLSGNRNEAIAQVEKILGLAPRQLHIKDKLPNIIQQPETRETIQALVLLGEIYSSQGKLRLAEQVLTLADQNSAGFPIEKDSINLGLIDLKVKKFRRDPNYAKTELNDILAVQEKLLEFQRDYGTFSTTSNLTLKSQAKLAEFRLLTDMVPKFQNFFLQLSPRDSSSLVQALTSKNIALEDDNYLPRILKARDQTSGFLQSLLALRSQISPALDRLENIETSAAFQFYYNESLSKFELIFTNIQALEAKVRVAFFTPPDLQLAIRQVAQSTAQESATALQTIVRRTANPTIKAKALQHLILLYPKQAKALRIKALSLAPDASIRYQIYHDEGKSLFQAGQFQAACNAYKISVEDLQSLRRELVGIDQTVQYDFRDRIEPVYREAILACLQANDKDSENLDQVRQFMEDLQLAELDNFFQEACVAGRRVNLDQALDQNSPQTALIYPILSKTRLDVLVKVSGVKGLRNYSTTFATDEAFEAFHASIQELQRALYIKDSSKNSEAIQIEAIQKPSRAIYDLLLRQLDIDLRPQVKTLVFVLDGELRNIPMGILSDGTNYLFENYAIALSPGLQLFRPERDSFSRQSVLAGGLNNSKRGPLPTDQEISIIKKYAGNPIDISLKDAFFTENALQGKISPPKPNQPLYRVIHLSTHAEFKETAADTSILTAGDVELSADRFSDILNMRAQNSDVPIELLIMSACETAKGNNRSVLGLSAVAVRSGVRSTIGTLQKIPTDDVVIDFIDQLYANLASGANKAQALQTAQKMLLKANPNSPLQIKALSSFVLIGDWL
jgi:CHAT domain-containing protein